MTTVVNVRSLPAGWEAQAEYVYIGRTGKGLTGYFGNPFPLQSEAQREMVYTAYVTHMKERVRNDPEFKRRVRGLAGKTLVCFCAPLRCHGNALMIMADHLAKQEAQA